MQHPKLFTVKFRKAFQIIFCLVMINLKAWCLLTLKLNVPSSHAFGVFDGSTHDIPSGHGKHDELPPVE